MWKTGLDKLQLVQPLDLKLLENRNENSALNEQNVGVRRITRLKHSARAMRF